MIFLYIIVDAFSNLFYIIDIKKQIIAIFYAANIYYYIVFRINFINSKIQISGFLAREYLLMPERAFCSGFYNNCRSMTYI